MRYQIYSEYTKNKTDDRAIVIPIREGIIACLADGATGSGDGDRASQIVIETLLSHIREPFDIKLIYQILRESDITIMNNTDNAQTTAIICFIKKDGQFFGASCGDSSIYTIRSNTTSRINNSIKPRLGNIGKIQEFAGKVSNLDRIMLCSDGINHQYINVNDIHNIPESSLIETLRGKEELYDDFSLILVSGFMK